MTIFYVLSARPPAPRPRRAPAAARPAATRNGQNANEEWCVQLLADCASILYAVSEKVV